MLQSKVFSIATLCSFQQFLHHTRMFHKKRKLSLQSAIHRIMKDTKRDYKVFTLERTALKEKFFRLCYVIPFKLSKHISTNLKLTREFTARH